MTEAKAIRNSVEGRDDADPFRDPADAIGRLRAVTRGPSATDLHERTLITCSECGHLHFDPIANTYTACPLASEGCSCVMQPRSYSFGGAA